MDLGGFIDELNRRKRRHDEEIERIKRRSERERTMSEELALHIELGAFVEVKEVLGLVDSYGLAREQTEIEYHQP